MPYESLSRARITQALRRLGELAHEQKITLEVSLYGGAVFTLVYGSRDATKDVDAVVRQSKVAQKLALKVAKEQGLPEDWLNDQVKQFLAEKERKRQLTEIDFGEGLRVSVPTAAYLLAMKLRASRPPLPGHAGDRADIRFLVRKMEIASIEAAEAIYDKFFPQRRPFGCRKRRAQRSTQGVATMSFRPATLKEIAQRSDSIGDFGRHLRDWLHELRRASSRTQAAATFADEPPRLREKFPQGKIADAWLGAYAEHLAGTIGVPPPEWAFAPWRTSDDPLFDEGSTPGLRTLALMHAPLAFKRRNIFTHSVDLPLALRAGRPAKSAEEKRKANAERQRRFREARRDELAALRKRMHKRAR